MRNTILLNLCLLLLVLSGCKQHDTQPFEKARAELQAYKENLDARIATLPKLQEEMALLKKERVALVKAKGKAGKEAIKPFLARPDTPSPSLDLPVYDEQALSPEEKAQIDQLVYEIKMEWTKIPFILETEERIAKTKAGIEKLKML
jgi:hypothetical protein